MGRMDERGFFTLVDRRKNMILAGGFNVYPAQIEQAIYEHPDVAECIVIRIPDAHRGQAAKALYRPKTRCRRLHPGRAARLYGRPPRQA
jgi:long-chain acyl-CoA synthetase